MDHYHLATRGDSDGLWDWNLAANRVHFAPRWIAMVGCEDHEVGHTPDEWLDRVHPEDRAEVRREIDARLEGGPSEFSIEHRMLHKNGTYRWMACHAVVVRDEGGRPVRMMGFHADITADKVADPATGLPNRVLFLDRLERAIEQAKRDPRWLFAALVLDLERPASAQAPAAAGAPDSLLAAAARRLETCLRTGDAPASLGRDYVVSRLGGDQFGILLEGLGQVGDARVCGQRVLSGMLAPFAAGGHEVFVQPSIGVAVSATGYRRAEDVLRDADIALHRAAALGRGRCEVFDTAVVDSAHSQVEMETELERALERREFILYYQPIVSLATNRIAGLESLVRWQHPTRGLIPPLDFIPLAEKTGAIVRIGTWVVREACRQLSVWRSTLAISRDLWVSVNFSGVQFRHPTVLEQVSAALRESGLDPRCLMVELTESTVMESPAAARGLIMQLRVMGVRVGLDDFGTGHSALAYLHQFPADFLKVDRSFVRGLESRQDMAEIIRTVNGLADQLGLEVIAEGIERDEQLSVIRSLRCGYVQGFLLARPVDAERTAALLQAGSELPLDTRRSVETERPREDPAPAAAPAAPMEGRWGWRTLLAAAAAVILLISVGLVVQGVTRPRVAAGTPARPQPDARVAAAEPPAPVPTAQGTAVRPADPNASSPAPPVAPATRRTDAAPAKAAGGPARPTSAGGDPGVARKTATQAAPAPATAGPSVETFPVVHLHVLGSCTGRLHVTPAGVTFAPDKGKDGFALDYGAFLFSLAEGALVIKSDTKTYRFRPASEGNGDVGVRLQKMLESITLHSQAR